MNPESRDIATLLRDPALAPVLAALPHARLAGGAVRDTLLGLAVADIDLATPDPPEETLSALKKAGIRAVPTGLAHGTVTAISAGRPFEITTLRTDLATDGRHAQVAWTADWRQDAARRDFTINAMSLDRGGRIYDYFGGQADLAAGRVRFVGDAATRITEDYLRILRFFRFQARYGRGPTDAQAAAAIRGHAAGVATLSAERVWHELKRILAAPDPGGAIASMAALGVLQIVLPEGANPARLEALINAGAPADPMLRLAALATPNAATLAARMKMSGAEAAVLAAAQAAPVLHAGLSDNDVRRLLADHDLAVLTASTWLSGPAGAEGAALRERLLTTPPPRFPLEGRHALALGAAPGPAVGEALRAVRQWWLAGGCTADEAACNDALRAALARAGGLPAVHPS